MSRTAILRKKVPLMLSMVGLAAKIPFFSKQLSGGEQQRVAIARALINEPSILLADEPTGNLDNNNAWEIMKLLEEINSKGTTVIVVTHNLEIVKVMKKTCDHSEKRVRLSVTVRKVATTMRINTFFYSIRQGLKIYFEIKCFRLLPWQPWRPAFLCSVCFILL